ncbi:hypothetical protein I316_03342 [Kwoniella heveanensis BCC8398]|uniref:Cytoplasmic protein n=1 Tax=Kwoniella heveanensis BCC8398 TaxID=1296120 RepID=A0A1B9GUU2_9TREE|nr:hypothetical protein I316_03342 [Kwoniella heveanensis BCC8398]
MAYELEPPLPRTATPSDYTRFKFDTSNVPDKRIVGLLACQRDPLLRSMRTTIHSARQASIKAPPPPKGKDKAKKPKGQSSASSANGNDSESGKEDKGALWEVELLDTVIFPEGGGQPADTGILHLLNPNGDVETTLVIEGCLRQKLDSVHLIRVPPRVSVQWDEGREVEVVVDWERRMDHMTIHTSQHLLSAILDTLSLPTLSWSMHPHPSLECPYVELPRSLSPQEAEDVEKRCNALIFGGRRVWVDISVQGALGGAEDGETLEEREGRTIPKDYDGGVIRHINIQDTDRNACCGTQLPDLSFLSLIHVVPPTTSSPSPTKLYFTSGPRAIRYLTESSRQLSSVAKILGRARNEVVKTVEQSEFTKKEAVDNLKSLRGEMSKFIAERAVQEAQSDAGKGVVWIKRDERSTHDFEFLGNVAAIFTGEIAAASTNKSTELTASAVPVLILTSASPSGSSATIAPSPTLLMVISSDNDLAKKINENIKAALGGAGRVKGGGAKGRYMSKIDGKWGKAELGAVQGVVDALRDERG